MKKATEMAAKTTKVSPFLLPIYSSTSGMDAMITAIMFVMIKEKKEKRPTWKNVVICTASVVSFALPSDYSCRCSCKESTNVPNAERGAGWPSSSRYVISNQSGRETNDFRLRIVQTLCKRNLIIAQKHSPSPTFSICSPRRALTLI